jgi:hypothetical protein
VILASITVSPKTPRDGKLEISPEVAVTLAGLGLDFAIRTPAGEDRAQVSAFTCTCEKRAEGPHDHFFLESPLLKSLVPGSRVNLELSGGQVTVSKG